jgi:transposase
MLSVRDVMAKLAVGQRTVLHWLNSGQLRGSQLSRRPGARRPSWRVSEEALAAFLSARTGGPVEQPARRRKRATGETAGTYYPE